MGFKLVLTEAFIVGIIILIIAFPVMKIQEYYYPGDVASQRFVRHRRIVVFRTLTSSVPCYYHKHR
jgi:hypothetical protein